MYPTLRVFPEPVDRCSGIQYSATEVRIGSPPSPHFNDPNFNCDYIRASNNQKFKTYNCAVACGGNLRSGINFEKVYNDAQRWSTAFQSYVQLTMVDIHSKESEHGIKLMERSLYSARYCFVENLYMSKLMTELDYVILCKFFNWIQESHNMHVDLIVYLQATPKTCQDRIRARNRHEEQSVLINYLQSLHNLHEDWLIDQKKFKVPCPVLVINTDDCDRQDMYKRFDEQMDSILQRNKENIN